MSGRESNSLEYMRRVREQSGDLLSRAMALVEDNERALNELNSHVTHLNAKHKPRTFDTLTMEQRIKVVRRFGMLETWRYQRGISRQTPTEAAKTKRIEAASDRLARYIERLGS